MIPELSKKLKIELEGGTVLTELIKDVNKLKEVDIIGKKSLDKKLVHAWDIVWDNIKNEERVGKNGADARKKIIELRKEKIRFKKENKKKEDEYKKKVDEIKKKEAENKLKEDENKLKEDENKNNK
jgi:hypothetical protein